MRNPQDQIQAYLNNSLSEEERIAFEKEVGSNSQLQEILKEELIIDSGVKSERDSILLEKMRNLEESIKGKTRVPQFLRWAAIIFLLAIPTYFLITPNPSSPSQLYDDYFVPYDNVIGPVRGEETGNPMLRYDAGDFEGAIEDLQEALSTDPKDSDYAFYLGISFMQTSQFEKAIATFAEIPESNRFSRMATWYAGLSHLKTGDIQNARIRFNNLSDSSGSYKEDATTILKSLD